MSMAGESGHLSIFTLLKRLMKLLKYNFFRTPFYTLPKTLIACRDMQLRFFKVKTLLNNAFNKKARQVIEYHSFSHFPPKIIWNDLNALKICYYKGILKPSAGIGYLIGFNMWHIKYIWQCTLKLVTIILVWHLYISSYLCMISF